MGEWQKTGGMELGKKNAELTLTPLPLHGEVAAPHVMSGVPTVRGRWEKVRGGGVSEE